MSFSRPSTMPASKQKFIISIKNCKTVNTRRILNIQPVTLKMTEPEAHTNSNTPTILDYLDEDCWQTLLDYVPLPDIILSEPVSRRWQRVVLLYLQRVRISIEHPIYNVSGKIINVRKWRIGKGDFQIFESLVKDLGPSIVACFCADEKSVQIVGENCPNLEAVLFINVAGKVLQKNVYENFKWLRRLCYKNCAIKDIRIAQFVAHSTLRELEFNLVGGKRMTGQCLTYMKSKHLKTLVFKNCWALETGYLLSAEGCYHQLTKFELTGASRAVYKDVHLVLDKMPQLEHVQMCNFESVTNDEFFKSVARLRHLRYLFVNFEVTDENLEEVTRNCKELQVLRLTSCTRVSKRGLAAACACASARLTMLGVYGSFYLTDDDVIACFHACPNLALCQI